MRSYRRLTAGLVLVIALALPGCDSDQPAVVTSETLTIQIAAGNARAIYVNVFDGFEDWDFDNLPDGERFVWCEFVPDLTRNPPFAPAPGVTVPWGYGVEVSIIPAGQTVPIRITPAAALGLNSNITIYSNQSFPQLPVTNREAILEMGRRFVFSNPRTLTTAHREVIAGTTNPLSALNPAMYGLGNGLCSTNDPGPSTLGASANPLNVPLGKGDTVIVRATRGDDQLGSPFISGAARLGGELFVNGRSVQPTGIAITGPEPGSAMTFSFTSR